MSLARVLILGAGAAFSVFLALQIVGAMRDARDPEVSAMLEEAKRVGRLPSPADRLVGHWATDVGDHAYFSAPDGSRIGNYTMVQAPNGRVFHHRYQVLAEAPIDGTVAAKLLFANGSSRVQAFKVSEDGKQMESRTFMTGKHVTSSHTRVDDKTSI